MLSNYIILYYLVFVWKHIESLIFDDGPYGFVKLIILSRSSEDYVRYNSNDGKEN